MDKVQKRGFIKYNTPSPEPFRIELPQVTFKNLRSEFYIVWKCNSTFLFTELILTNEHWLFAVGLDYVALWPWPKKRSSRAMSEARRRPLWNQSSVHFELCLQHVVSLWPPEKIKVMNCEALDNCRELFATLSVPLVATLHHIYQCWKWICCCRNNY
jgi:hypothetical protein